MFGFSLAAQLFQGSAQRTWNCVTQFTNKIWYKFNDDRHTIMPRSRRRHHSRSRSRSRSHSHDRDRDVKRRKIDNVDSPTHKRSVSFDEPEEKGDGVVTTTTSTISVNDDNDAGDKATTKEVDGGEDNSSNDKGLKKLEDKLVITPQKAMSPKQLRKKLESEKKRQQKQSEREERERKKNEEKEKLLEEKLKKQEEKAKEREQKEESKRKEREDKEQKRKEREEREEQKRKERELEKLRKQQEIDKKKQKEEEKKQKAAAAFVNFFVPKKASDNNEEKKGAEVLRNSLFMPFEVKSDMRMAPRKRHNLTDSQKDVLDRLLKNPLEDGSYLKDLKGGKAVGKSSKTWPYEDTSDEVLVVDEDFGESIGEDKPKLQRMRAKFLKFEENRRPAYYGTWRKKSARIVGRRPFASDSIHFDYDVDSDDDWEEDEQGESLNGSDDEEKETEQEIDEYEVDNDFFVPHGHLSDDEVDDETNAKLSPESLKQKLKLLKDEFDQDMQTKTNKMKPRSIGCVWYKKNGSNVDETIERHLRPLAMITNGRIVIRKRNEFVVRTPSRKQFKELQEELIPHFLKLIHGNVNNKRSIVEQFLVYMQNNGYGCDVSKANLGRNLKRFAQWKKCPDDGPMLNKFCWYVNDDVKERFSAVNLAQPK